jgi:hypothetical protein
VLITLKVNEDDKVLVDVIVMRGVYEDVEDEEVERVNEDDPVSDFVTSALTDVVDDGDSVAATESVKSITDAEDATVADGR